MTTVTTEVRVRDLAPGDREGWFRLWAGYLEFYETEVADAVSERTWGRLMDAAAPVHGLVADCDNRVAGILNYVLHDNTWATAPVCYLEDLFVDPALRGQGAGRALIEALVEEAQSRGWHRVYWMTKADNATARDLYDKLADATDWVRYDAHM